MRFLARKGHHSGNAARPPAGEVTQVDVAAILPYVKDARDDYHYGLAK